MSAVEGNRHFLPPDKRDTRTAKIYRKFQLDCLATPTFVSYSIAGDSETVDLARAFRTHLAVQNAPLFNNQQGDGVCADRLAHMIKAVIVHREAAPAASIIVAAEKMNGFVKCSVWHSQPLRTFGNTTRAREYLDVIMDATGFWYPTNDEQLEAMHRQMAAMRPLRKGESDPTVMSIDQRIYLTGRLPSNFLNVQVWALNTVLYNHHKWDEPSQHTTNNPAICANFTSSLHSSSTQ